MLANGRLSSIIGVFVAYVCHSLIHLFFRNYWRWRKFIYIIIEELKAAADFVKKSAVLPFKNWWKIVINWVFHVNCNCDLHVGCVVMFCNYFNCGFFKQKIFFICINMVILSSMTHRIGKCNQFCRKFLPFSYDYTNRYLKHKNKNLKSK